MQEVSMADNFEEEIKKMVAEVIEVSAEKLDLDADFFRDLDVDSLKAIEIVAVFEKRYRILIPEKEIPKVRTVRQLVEFAKKLKK